jgi:apolipoprotein N-acyltransferase
VNYFAALFIVVGFLCIIQSLTTESEGHPFWSGVALIFIAFVIGGA